MLLHGGTCKRFFHAVPDINTRVSAGTFSKAAKLPYKITSGDNRCNSQKWRARIFGCNNEFFLSRAAMCGKTHKNASFTG